MRKIIFVLIVFSLILLSACFKEIPKQEIQACEFDSDCIFVFDVRCCKCQLSINKDYEEYWDKLGKTHTENCEGIMCEPCGPTKPIGQQCVNNTCSLVYSPIGI